MAKKNAEHPLSHAEIADAQFHGIAAIHANNTAHLHAFMHDHAARQSGNMAAAPHLIHNAFNPQHLNPQQKKPTRRS
jgi:hypothetical protein